MPRINLRAPDGRPWTLKEIVQGYPLGHPTHALLVHYPAAFPVVVLALDLATYFLRTDGALVAAAAYLAIAAVVLGLLAAIPGLVDWWGMIPGSAKRRVGTIHLLVQTASLAVLALGAAVRWPARDEVQAPLLATALTALAAVGMHVGNFFGGELVYRMGMRVSTGGPGESKEAR